MTLQVWIGQQGCGMGICAIADHYFKDREYIVLHKEEYPEKCQECIRLNEEEYRMGKE